MRARAQGKGVEGSVLDPLLAILVQVSRCAAKLHQSEIHRRTKSRNPWILSFNDSFLKPPFWCFCHCTERKRTNKISPQC